MFDVFGLLHFYVGETDNVDGDHDKNDNDGDEDDIETCFHNPFSRLAVS